MYLIVQIVDFLINTIVFGTDKVSLMEAGYKRYFFYKLDDLEKLVNWIDEDFKNIKITREESSPNYNLWFLVSQSKANQCSV